MPESRPGLHARDEANGRREAYGERRGLREGKKNGTGKEPSNRLASDVVTVV